MAEEKEKSFEFVDRRRVNTEAAEPNAAAEPEAASAQEPQAAAPEGQEPPTEGLPDVDVYGLLASFLGVLHSFAWQKMGFVANPSTGKVESDLPQAKVAIDTVQFLVGQLEQSSPKPRCARCAGC